MKCPNCDIELIKINYREVEVDSCSNCGGKWFENREVDQLEDQVMAEDDLKNSMIGQQWDSTKKCPDCGKEMKEFEYRWEDGLNLDYCSEGHGFWLESGEEEKVNQVMTGYKDDLIRSQQLENEWDGVVRNLVGRNWFRIIKDKIGL